MWVKKACIIMYASDYRLGLQWMPLDLLIQHVHHALKVMYSYRHYNYTDGHSIYSSHLLHSITITPIPHGLYLFMLFRYYLLRIFFIHQPHPESIVVSYQVVVTII